MTKRKVIGAVMVSVPTISVLTVWISVYGVYDFCKYAVAFMVSVLLGLMATIGIHLIITDAPKDDKGVSE